MNPSGFESRQRDVLSRGCATTDEEYLSELRDRVSVLDLIIRRRKAEKHIIREKIKEVEIEKGIDGMHTYCLLKNDDIVILYAATDETVTVYPINCTSDDCMVHDRSDVAMIDSNLSYLKMVRKVADDCYLHDAR